jgi:hypothetical protein
MHPELLSSLATEHRRDLAARLSREALTDAPAPARHRPARLLPRLRVSWQRTTLAAVGGPSRDPGRSWVIVISATRTL